MDAYSASSCDRSLLESNNKQAYVIVVGPDELHFATNLGSVVFEPTTVRIPMGAALSFIHVGLSMDAGPNSLIALANVNFCLAWLHHFLGGFTKIHGYTCCVPIEACNDHP